MDDLSALGLGRDDDAATASSSDDGGGGLDELDGGDGDDAGTSSAHESAAEHGRGRGRRGRRRPRSRAARAVIAVGLALAAVLVVAGVAAGGFALHLASSWDDATTSLDDAFPSDADRNRNQQLPGFALFPSLSPRCCFRAPISLPSPLNNPK